MARRFPTFVVLLPLMAACATTAPVSEGQRITSPDGEAVYLQGITTRYSVRLDELRTKQSSSRADFLPHAVVAGDATMTVAGSLYRHPDVFAVDLIIRNHGADPIEVDRSQIELVDDEDRALHPRMEWTQGMNYGLRALQVRNLNFRPMGTDHQAGQSGVGDDDPQRVPTKPQAATSSRVQSALLVGETPMDVSWISDLAREQNLVTVPTQLTVAPGASASYWAYWDAVPVSYPVTVSVRIGGKRMLLRFEDPKGSMTAR